MEVIISRVCFKALLNNVERIIFELRSRTIITCKELAQRIPLENTAAKFRRKFSLWAAMKVSRVFLL